jgi:hypothetical protein
MGLLFFKKPLQTAILAGLKRTTIRRWPEGKPRVKAGRRAFAPGVGWLAILAVEAVEIAALSDADALADGFPSADELRRVLVELYPEQMSDGKAWFRVAFTLDEPLKKG